MRYIAWNLKWSDDGRYGYGPEGTADLFGSVLQSSMWVDNKIILGYLQGDVAVSNLSLWNAVELSQSEALDFATRIASEAFLLPDGTIGLESDEETETAP